MDAWVWGAIACLIAVVVAVLVLAPHWHAQHLARQLEGRAGGGLAGIGSGFDAVWRPSADEARIEWEAQIEIPAPAPSPADKDRLDEGKIVITPPALPEA